MFLFKILDFFFGYVIITLKGFYIERFINICMRRNIRIWGIKRLDKNKAVVCMRIAEFKKIRPIVRKTYTMAHIEKKCGLPILLYRYRKRYVLTVGVCAVFLFMTVMSNFIWIIDVKGLENLSKEEIIQAANEAGVYEGARKRNLKNIQNIRDVINNRVDGLAWIWIYVEGAKATIEIREKTLPPMVVDKNMPCDVAAMKDALIKKITVKEGTTVFKPGDAVLAGETVISGTMFNNDNSKVRYVHALGVVEASTWYEKKGTYKLYEEIRTPTGNEKNKYTLNLFSNTVNLYFNNEIPYENYDKTEFNNELKIGDAYVGIGIGGNGYKEVTVERVQLPIETAVERAKNELEESIAKELTVGAELVDNKLTYKQLDDETIEVTVTMEFVEKIGTERKIQVQEDTNVAKKY